MILSDLISIPQHRAGEYPEARLLMGASISHCGKPASLLTPAQLCPGWSVSPHGHPVHRPETRHAAWNRLPTARRICYWKL